MIKLELHRPVSVKNNNCYFFGAFSANLLYDVMDKTVFTIKDNEKNMIQKYLGVETRWSN